MLEITARALPQGDGYVVNGRKYYATGALFAHWVPVLALDGKNEAVLAFIRQGTPGLTVVDDWSGMGQRTTASGSVVVENVRVPREHVIHSHLAFDRPTRTGPVAQLIQAAVDAGIARGALDDTLTFLRTRTRAWPDSGQARATDDPHTIRDVGDLTIRLHAAEALLERAGRSSMHCPPPHGCGLGPGVGCRGQRPRCSRPKSPSRLVRSCLNSRAPRRRSPSST